MLGTSPSRNAIRHLLLGLAATGLAAGAYGLGTRSGSADAQSGRALAGLAEVGGGAVNDADMAASGGAELSRLRLLQSTVSYLGERYVDPARIDPDAMFDSALDAVELAVPEVLFRRAPSGGRLSMAVGTWSTMLEVAPIRDLADLVRELQAVGTLLGEHLSDEVSQAEVEYMLINGVLDTLDPHSVLLPPEASREMAVENDGEFGGLGITITLREGWLTVEYPLEDTPAWDAGLKPADRILRIDGESTINLDLTEAVARLRGPKGSEVRLLVERDSFSEPREFVLQRDTIQINEVKGEMLEGAIGYVSISSFHQNVKPSLDEVLGSFREGEHGAIRGLILDLRGNSGGYLDQAVKVSDTFIAEGVVVATVDRNNTNRREERARANATEPNYPMVVLVDASSASASEIVAGALKNLGRAVVVGERTFGKGSVQNLYPSPYDESRLKLTVARYLTPGDRSIQSVGVEPDVRVIPTIVDEREADDGAAPYGFALLDWRDRVLREADYDHHFEATDVSDRPPAYTVRYLRDVTDDAERTDRRDLGADWEVQLARDLLLGTSGPSRAEILASAAPIVERRAQAEQQRVSAALQDLGLDWSDGADPDMPAIRAELDLGPDGVVVGGEEHAEVAWLRLTNLGSEPLHQTVASVRSSVEWIDGQEAVFGKVAPGETKSWPVPLELVEGYRDEVGTAAVTVRSLDGATLGRTDVVVRSKGHPLPSWAWSMSVLDDGTAATSGDGDGVPEEGETVVVRLAVTNRGAGDSAETFVKLKNKAGRSLDLEVGTVELGKVAAGATVTAELRARVLTGGALPVELLLGDNGKYDHGAVVRGGFYGYFTERLSLDLSTLASHESRSWSPPEVEVTRPPTLVSQAADVVLSGVATDDHGVRDVTVYHVTLPERGDSQAEAPPQVGKRNEEKLFFQGGGEGVSSLPYTVDAHLEPGANLLVIVARDGEGLSDVHSVYVWHDPSGKVGELAGM